MRICTLKRTKEILNEYNLFAKKGFGQNFIIDSNIIDKICNTINLENKFVIEIGPGIGALTEELLNRAQKVICYEIDTDMVKILNDNLSCSKLIIENIDFLEVDLKKDIEKYIGYENVDNIVIVSNLPYYITTPIIFKLLVEVDMINEFYFMVQKEVSKRLTSKKINCNSKDYGALSVIVDYKREANELFPVGRNSFYPVPNVDSEIIVMKKVKRDYNVKNESKFIEFVYNIFSMKRKTLVNNLTSKYSINKDKIIEILKENGFSEGVRAEALATDEIVKLYKLLNLDID